MKKDIEFETCFEKVKNQAVEAIAQEMKKAKLTQTELAISVGLPQPRISDLVNGKTQKFGIDGINRVLACFDLSIHVYYDLAPLTKQTTKRYLLGP